MTCLSNAAPLVTIGMPVYNGELYLARALDSLIRQDYEHWNLLIADNNSSDSTSEIAKDYTSRDSRISYIRHAKNLGAVRNFIYFSSLAETPYFMWAASDDEWSRNYISSCVGVLESHRDLGFVGGSICNIDSRGTCIRIYDSFSDFDNPSTEESVCRFISAIEVNGKANMIYSVFRAGLHTTLCRIPNILDGWGADMAFVAAGLSRARYRQASQATLYKRVVSESDIQTARLLGEQRNIVSQYGGNFPPSHAVSYIRALTRGMPSLGMQLMVMKIMLFRCLRLLARTIVKGV